MFGESESESPRVGSPWDSFLAGSSFASPSPHPGSSAELEIKSRLTERLPKLIPEVEYGNVEYKLKLLNPSPERFTRLVTQMKWRLLEGGGQAYYELGVADSGQLVGLPRKDLEQSLETLEMMAGEIGASVIVVKEIEVPAALVGRGMNFALGIPQRTPVPAIAQGETELSATTETETSTTEDDEDIVSLTPDAPFADNDDQPPTRPIAYHQTQFIHPTHSHPERPASQSSPAIHALRPDTTDLDADTLFHLDFEIEISSVYKPRPHRSRPPPIPQSKYTKRRTPPKPKLKRLPGGEDMDPLTQAVEKRTIRDARRNQRRRALLADVGSVVHDQLGATVSELGTFHVDVDSGRSTNSQSIVKHFADLQLDESSPRANVYDSTTDADADVDAHTISAHADADTPEPRLIVEALVVRKLALEEAFLDFGGFALEV